MNIIVLLKRTFDTEEQIVIREGRLEEDGVEYIINPYDEYAVEEAMKLKEEHGGEVTILSVGPAEAEKQLRTALAMGADKAFLVDVGERWLDERAISLIVQKMIQDQPFDLILAGNVSIDNGAAQVALRVAELLDIAHASAITKLTLQGEKAWLERDVEGDVELLELNLPALLTAQQGLNEPRYPSLPGIMKAKRKPLQIFELEELELTEDQLQPQTERLEIFNPAQKELGKILEGELEEQVQELVQLLQGKEKVI